MSFSQRLLPIRKDNKYGYINTQGKIVAPCRFNYAPEFSEGFAAVRMEFNVEDFDKQKYSIFNEDLQEIGSLTCSECGEFSDGLMDFERDDLYGYVNSSLNMVIKPSFSLAREFNNGLTTATYDELSGWGVINKLGEWTIDPIFEYIWSFGNDENITAYSLNGVGWGLINRKGVYVTDPRYSYIGLSSGGLMPAAITSENRNVSKYGIINEYGDWITTPEFDAVSELVDGTLGAAINNRWGVAATDGTWIIEPQFTYTEPFYEGLSRVYVGGNYDSTGVSGGKFGYIDCNGDFAIKPQFDDALAFKNGVAKVELFAGSREESTARRTGYIDREGHYIWEPTT